MRRQHSRRNRAMAVLGCMVALATAFALMMPAITMTRATQGAGLAATQPATQGAGQAAAQGSNLVAGSIRGLQATATGDDGNGDGATDAATPGEEPTSTVAIQVTKSVVSSTTGQEINLASNVTNHFTLKTDTDADPANVTAVNRGAYNTAYDTSGYTEAAQQPSSFDITVSGAEASTTLIANRTPGMYTITEDPASIPDKVIDAEGKVWTYAGTRILTEYAWRTVGDEGQYHYSDLFTRDNGDYTAVPEMAGSYGTDLYNGRLDFIVSNYYAPTEETAEVEKMNLQLNKAWSRGDDTTPPTSGSVTFLLHQVATTTVDDEGEGGGEDDSHGSGDITVQLYKSDRSTLLGYMKANVGEIVTFSYTANAYQGAGVTVDRQYSWGVGSEYLTYTQSDADGTGSFSYTVNANDVAEDVVKLFFNGDIAGFALDSGSGSGSSSANTTTETDPAGSGFPKQIVLTAGGSWSDVESNLISKIVSGNTTTTYSYYLEEIEVTGLASAYTDLSFSGAGSPQNPAAATDDGQTVIVNATNSVPNPNDKFIKLHKNWVDQDDNPLTNHPDEVLVDIYRVKLPSGVGSAGGVTLKSEGDVYAVIGDPSTWQDNNNYVPSEKIFNDASGQYFYIRSNNQSLMSRSQLEEFARRIANGEKVQGDWVTSIRPSPVYTPKQLWNNGAGLDIPRGSLCLYEGEYYVLLDTGDSYGGIMHSNGGPGKEGQWERVAEGLVVSNIEIEPPSNKLLITEESIETTYIPELRKLINKQLEKYNMTWSEEESQLVPYKVGGEQVTIPIGEVDSWETSFTAEAGYLYFFFERPVPGFTTLYGNEEHGVFGQTQDVIIQNQTTVGTLTVSKTWTSDQDITSHEVYVKVHRDGIDITDELAYSPQSYGLTSDDFYPHAGHYYLKVPVNGAAKTLQGLPIAEYDQDATPYQYSVLERGYHDPGNDAADSFGIVWDVSDVLQKYTTTYAQRQEDGSYVAQAPVESTAAESSATPVGAVSTVTTTNPETQTTETNAVFTAGRASVTIGNADDTPDETLDIDIIKVDANDAATTLTGAKFVLQRYDSREAREYTKQWDEAEVDANGKLVFEGLAPGFYKLIETKSPAGYVKTASDPWFQVKAGEGGGLTVDADSEASISYTPKTDTANAAIRVKNEPGEPLPVTGGTGTSPFTAVGSLLVVAAGVVLMRRANARRFSKAD